MNKQNIKAFSFVEIIIVISILILLSVVAISISSNMQEKTDNTAVNADISTLINSFESYLNENWNLPDPAGNKNYFTSDTSYAHSVSTAFWVHGFVKDNILPAKYLNYLPLDPKTKQFYAYWKTLTWSLNFEIAAVIWDNWLPVTKLEWTYPWEEGPISLIREYNWPSFLSNKSNLHFPYNPEERLLTAKIDSYSWNVTIDGYTWEVSEKTLVAWDTIKVETWWYADIYFSDWSVSTLWDESNSSEITLSDMSYKVENNLITKIRIALSSGTLWTKATNLDEQSEFDVFTQDATAAVRWTIFALTKTNNSTEIKVEIWKVQVKKITDKVNISSSKDLANATKDINLNQNQSNDYIEISDFWINELPSIIKHDSNIWSYIEVTESDNSKWVRIENDYIQEITNPLKLKYDKVDNFDLSNVVLKVLKYSHANKKVTFWYYHKNIENVKISFSWEEKDCATEQDEKWYKISCENLELADNKVNIKLFKEKKYWDKNKKIFTASIDINKDLELTETAKDLKDDVKETYDDVKDIIDEVVSLPEGGEEEEQKQDEETCNWIEVNWDCWENYLSEEGYVVKYYAPYNNKWDLKLYDKQETTKSAISNWILSNEVLLPAYCITGSDKSKSYCNFWDWKWVLVDNSWEDKIKYESLDLWSNFAIEIWVKWEALNRSNTESNNEYTLFHTSSAWKIRVYLNEKTWNIKILWLISWNPTFKDYNLSKPYIWNQKIIFIFNEWLTTLKVGSSPEWTWNFDNISVNEIYFWSDRSNSNQWNDIIDYIKIYKKGEQEQAKEQQEVDIAEVNDYIWYWCEQCPYWYWESDKNRDRDVCWFMRWEKNERYCNNIIWWDWLEVICAREKWSWLLWCDWWEKWNWNWTKI